MFWVFEKGIFQFNSNFWVTKLKPFSGKARPSLQNHLNSKLIIGSFLENGFEATWDQKRMFWVFKKKKFSVSCNFCVTKLKLFSGRVKQDIHNCLNQNFVIASLLENSFLKRHFSVLFSNFWVTKLKRFTGGARQSLQDHLNSKLVIGSFLEKGFEASSKMIVLSVRTGYFKIFFPHFWVAKLKPFSGKARQSLQDHLNSK